MAAWVVRAKDLDIISQNQYTLMFKDLSIRGWRKQEPIEYLGDEEPLQLKQMSLRAVAEGLTSPDRITVAFVLAVLDDAVEEQNSEHLTVHDSTGMNEDDRETLIMKHAWRLLRKTTSRHLKPTSFTNLRTLMSMKQKTQIQSAERRHLVGQLQLTRFSAHATGHGTPQRAIAYMKEMKSTRPVQQLS